MEFKSFEKISKFSGIAMTITQKIHGSNAQILITEEGNCEVEPDKMQSGPDCKLQHKDGIEVNGIRYVVKAGSRSRWLTTLDDNFGFARYVKDNEVEIIEKLGLGTHFGEWAGPGINSGEGLSEKKFVIFNHYRFPPERPLPPQMVVVPVIYHGPYDERIIAEAMTSLKIGGSLLSPGFMRPEGVVIEVVGKKYKKVFDAEETQWTRGSAGPKVPKPEGYDASHLLQPVRLEKLLSRDEKFLAEYPSSLASIVKGYVADLIEEGQITGSENEIKSVQKAASGQIFSFIREFIDTIDRPV